LGENEKAAADRGKADDTCEPTRRKGRENAPNPAEADKRSDSRRPVPFIRSDHVGDTSDASGYNCRRRRNRAVEDEVMSTPAGPGTLTIGLPESLLVHIAATPEAIVREVRLAAAIRWLRLGRISLDEAAEVAGLGHAEFDTALAEATRAPREETIPSGRPFTPEEAEAHYQVLGAWKGPAAARDVQRAAKEFWRDAGGAGVRWLVGRLHDEVVVDALHGAGSMLADLGDIAIAPIVERLRGDPSHDQALTLLKALGWLGESDRRPRLAGAEAELILAERLQDEDPDMREAAACAMRLLNPQRARRWLERRFRDEPDAEVRRTLEEELARHQALRT
jgi:hypothetical protein